MYICDTNGRLVHMLRDTCICAGRMRRRRRCRLCWRLRLLHHPYACRH